MVSPVPRYGIAIGKALGGTSIAVVQGAVLLLLAPLVNIALSVPMYFGMLGVLTLMALALNGLGLLIASRMNSMQGFQVVMNFLIMPLFFLSGALYPLKGMPQWLEDLMRVDPLTYGVDALRHLVYAGTVLAHVMTEFAVSTDLLVMSAITVVLLALSTWAFSGAKSG
jgi:ABC-2 type transport system permease protein